MNVSYPPTTGFGGFAEQTADRSAFQRQFPAAILAEPQVRGRVLDVGCGHKLQPFFRPIREACAQFDGVDVTPEVWQHPDLDQRWQAPFEQSDVPDAAYDLAYAYNVVEHVPAARPFFEKLRRVLKPGGVFWALTPHAAHPFCWLTRASELVGVKARMARDRPGAGWNDYSSYYRLNRPGQILRAVDGLGFESVAFHYIPCVQWDAYFPRPLRWAPHLYDRLLGSKYRPFMQLLAYRLQTPAAP